jgi:ElaB/YqjD/DUF883 family membrane-anchored ribosome-binding protein
MKGYAVSKENMTDHPDDQTTVNQPSKPDRPKNGSTSEQVQANSETAMPQSDIDVQLLKLKSDVASLAKTVAAYGADAAGAYTAKVRQGANDAVEASQTAIDGIRSDFASLESEVVDRVRARPLQAMGVALGIGFLLAIVSRR